MVVLLHGNSYAALSMRKSGIHFSHECRCVHLHKIIYARCTTLWNHFTFQTVTKRSRGEKKKWEVCSYLFPLYRQYEYIDTEITPMHSTKLASHYGDWIRQRLFLGMIPSVCISNWCGRGIVYPGTMATKTIHSLGEKHQGAVTMTAEEAKLSTGSDGKAMCQVCSSTWDEHVLFPLKGVHIAIGYAGEIYGHGRKSYRKDTFI